MLVLLVGAEVPLADEADAVALDVDGVEPDVPVDDVWLVVEVLELVVVVLVSVEEEEEEEEEEVELGVVVVMVDGERVAATELEPSTLITSL